MGTPRVFDPLNADWIGVTLLLLVVMLAYVNIASPKKWRLLWQTTFRFRLGRQTMREDVDLQDRTLLGLLLAAIVVLALFAYQAAVLRGVSGQGLSHFFEIMGMVALVTLAQVVLLRSTAFLFEGDGGTGEYLYTLLLLQVFLGLALLPITALVAYQVPWRNVLVPVGILLAVLVVGYRWVRGAVIGLGAGTRPAHIFLYICALEILPIALAIRGLR